jgi:hypothetical protein
MNNYCSRHRVNGQWTESLQLSYLTSQIMNSKHLTDSCIQGYLIHKIRLEAPGWSNIETGLSEGELLDKAVQKLPYCVMTHQQSTKCVTTLSTVITLQHVIITFLENSRLVRELVNKSQNVANALYIVQRFRK